MGAELRQADRPRERRCRHFERVELRAEVQQESRVETGSQLPGE
jgi:hypothetical protein